MRQVLKKIGWRLEYGALLLLFNLARLLPWPRLVSWGSRLGHFVYHVLPIRRQVVLENLRAAFGAERSEAEIEGIARDFYAHLGTTLLEFCAFRSMSAADIRAVTSLENVEYLEECRARGKGALIVSGHYGNWELLGAAATCRDYPITFLAKTQSNPYVDRMQTELRRRVGIGLIRQGASVKELVRAIRRGDFIGLLGDQDAGGEGVFVDFLGRPASVFRGTAYFAYRLGCPIIPAFIHRLSDGSHRITLTAPIAVDPSWDEETAIREMTLAHTRRLEETIRQNPVPYFWVHRRWKTRPPKAAPSSDASASSAAAD